MARLHFTPLLSQICLAFSLSVFALQGSLVSGNPSVQSDSQERCIDFELNKIDAITSLSNGSLFVVHNRQYWILKPNQIPSLANGRPVAKLINTGTSSANALKSETVAEPTIDAAVNVRIAAVNGTCVPTSQVLLYSWSETNRSVVSIYENDVLYSTANLSHVDIFRSAKSVDWERKIDGLAFWQNMTIIFQGKSFISIRCINGEWKEVVHKAIAEVFPGVLRTNLDSVIIRSLDPRETELATVFMFFGHEFYECSATGSDPCEGPYSLMSEFFNVDHFCPDSTLGRAESSKRFLTAIILLVVILFSVLLVALVFYFTIKPEHFTYFVNGKMRNTRDKGMSYEALKLQTEAGAAATGGVECKSVTNGKS